MSDTNVVAFEAEADWMSIAAATRLRVRGGLALARRYAGPDAARRDIENLVADALLDCLREWLEANEAAPFPTPDFIATIAAAASELAPEGWQHDGQMQVWEMSDLLETNEASALTERILSNTRALLALRPVS